MKKLCLLVILYLFTSTSLNAQIKGGFGGVSYSPKNIDVDALSSVIQKKQDEVVKRLFKNVIISYFNNNSITNDMTRLNNIATYNYFYAVSNQLFEGNNKTTIANAVYKETINYFLIYSIAINIAQDKSFRSLLINAVSSCKEKNSEILTYNKIAPLSDDIFTGKFIKVDASKANRIKTDNDPSNKTLTIDLTTGLNKDSIKYDQDIDVRKNNLFAENLLLDIVYDILLRNPAVTKKLNFEINPTWKSMISDKDVYNNMSFYNYYREGNKDVQKLKDSVSKYIDNVLRNKNDTIILDDLKTSLDGSDTVNKREVLLKSVICMFYNFNQIKDYNVTKLKELIQYFVDIESNKGTSFDAQSFIPFIMSAISSNISYDNKTKEFTIDVVEIISKVYEEYYKVSQRSNFAFLFNIGFNYSLFYTPQSSLLDNKEANIVFASEKIGIKYKFYNRFKQRSYLAGQWYKSGKNSYSRYLNNQTAPLIHDYYWQLYTSGILYNLVDVKTNNNLNFATLGTGLGVNFFNGLNLSVNLGLPLSSRLSSTNKWYHNCFFNFSVDVPIFDYLKEARSKKLANSN